MSNKEVDFPRGGHEQYRQNIIESSGELSRKSSRKRNNDLKLSQNSDTKNENKHQKNSLGEVWRKRMNKFSLKEGMLGLGCVKEINEISVTLEAVGGVLLELPATNISTKLTDVLKYSSKTLDDSVRIGQILAFKVIKESTSTVSETKHRKVESDVVISVDPSVVNFHIVPANLTHGLVLNASVESIEEKGVVMNLGLRSDYMKGFLSGAFLPHGLGIQSLIIGQVLLTRIHQEVLQGSRVLQLSGLVEGENLNERSVSQLHLNSLTPGTILYANPVKIVKGGAYVDIGNNLKAFLDARSMPPRLACNLSKFVDSLRVVVTLCQQNTSVLCLSAHPDIIAMSRFERRNNFEGLEIGVILSCKVTKIDTFGNIHFEIMDEKFVRSMIRAFATKRRLEEGTEYVVGSIHDVRVLSQCFFERLVLVSTKKDILAQKMVSFKDAKIGQKVKVTVAKILSIGLQVKIYPNVFGFIPVVHTSDKLYHRLSGKFDIGQKLVCRVLRINVKKKRIILTRKPSWLANQDRIISTYSMENIGKIGLGYVSRICDSGSIIISFYGNACALMLPKEASRLSTHIKIGTSLQVRIQRVDCESNRMLVTLADPTLVAENMVLRCKPFPALAGCQLVVSAKILKSAVFQLGTRKRERLDIVVNLNDGKRQNFETSLPSDLVSDNLDAPFETLVDCLRPKTKVSEVTLLGVQSGSYKVTSKRFVASYQKRFGRVESFEGLSKGQLVCAIVTQYNTEFGFFVEVVGGAALSAPVSFLSGHSDESNRLLIGQTVVGKVSYINPGKQRFALVMDAPACFHNDEEDATYFGFLLLDSALNELEWLAVNNFKNVELPNLGSIIEVSVVHALLDGISLSRPGKTEIIGTAKPGNYPSRSYEEGDQLRALVLWICFPSCHLNLYILNESNQRKLRKTAKSCMSLRIGETVRSKVSMITRDVIATVSESDGIASVIYLPSRFHPNIVPPITSSRFAMSENIPIVLKARSNSAFIGFHENDKKEQHIFFHPAAKDRKSAIVSDATARMKPFHIYPAKVLGNWRHDLMSSNTSIELELPGGSLGRMHASETDEKYHKESCRTVEEFLHDFNGKSINVKVIGISKMKAIVHHNTNEDDPRSFPSKSERNVTKMLRVIECTMRPSKLSELKKKQSILGYPQRYVHGSTITVFVKDAQKDGMLRVEASPLWDGIIRKQNLGENSLIENLSGDPHSALIDVPFQPGQIIRARIIGINRSVQRRHRKCLELSLVASEKVVAGERTTARVIGIANSPTSVVFELSNGQRATITATGVCNDYKRALSVLQSYKINDLRHIWLIRFVNRNGTWLAATEDRFVKSSSKIPKQNRLITDPKQISTRNVLDAFVVSNKNKKIRVEIGPGVVGIVDKATAKNAGALTVDSLVKVKISKIASNDQVTVAYVKTLKEVVNVEIESKASRAVSRKRVRSLSETDSKSKCCNITKTEPSSPLKRVKFEIADPGFDWSLQGYTRADFAAVGRICDYEPENTVEKDVAEIRVTDSSHRHMLNGQNEIQYEKPSELDEEIALERRERELLSDDFIPQSSSDFDRLLVGNPNSSLLWIKLISFFVERNDLGKARGSAERALQIIHFREEEEIFNVWTAYLNLEISYGNKKSLRAVFERAVQNTDALKMHKQMAKIYQKANNIEEADFLFEEMIKRYRNEDLDVWCIYAQHLLETNRADKARDLFKRAIISAGKQDHVALLTRFAQIEYKFGDMEQGKTIFESILNAYPKKSEIWTVYIDFTIKSGRIDEARSLFERITSKKFSFHKMKLFYTKWIETEERFGDEKRVDSVKQLALQYAETVAAKATS